MEGESKIVVGGNEIVKENNIENHQNPEVAKFAAYGGFGRRYAAAILDYGPIGIVWIPVQIFVVYKMPELASNFASLDPENVSSPMEMFSLVPNSIGIAYVIYLVAYLVNMAYNIYLYFKTTQTIGYKILGMEIIYEKTGEKPSTARLGGRFGGKFLTMILFVIPFVNIITIIASIVFVALKKKRLIHDRIANTLVVLKKVEKTGLVGTVNVVFIAFMILSNIMTNMYLMSNEDYKKTMFKQSEFMSNGIESAAENI